MSLSFSFLVSYHLLSAEVQEAMAMLVLRFTAWMNLWI